LNKIKNAEQSDAAELGGLPSMRVGGSFYHVLFCVLANFRSPPNPLIAGVICIQTSVKDDGIQINQFQ